MWWAPIAAAGVSALGNLLSSGGSSSSGRISDEDRVTANYWDTQKFEREFAANKQMQEEFAQMGIRWRVEDAQAAGLHPLFALGGQIPAGQPISVGASSAGALSPEVRSRNRVDWGAMGQDLARAAGAFDNRTKELQEIELQRARLALRKDEVLLMGAESELARRAQADYQSTPIELMPEHPPGSGVRVKALEQQGVIEGRPLLDNPPGPVMPGHISGPVQGTAMWEQYNAAPGFKVLLPKGNDVADIFEDKPFWFWSMVVAANTREYGPTWPDHMRKLVPPDSSFGHYLKQLDDTVSPYANPGARIYEDIRRRVLKYGEQYRR